MALDGIVLFEIRNLQSWAAAWPRRSYPSYAIVLLCLHSCTNEYEVLKRTSDDDAKAGAAGMAQGGAGGVAGATGAAGHGAVADSDSGVAGAMGGDTGSAASGGSAGAGGAALWSACRDALFSGSDGDRCAFSSSCSYTQDCCVDSVSCSVESTLAFTIDCGACARCTDTADCPSGAMICISNRCIPCERAGQCD